MNIKKLILMLIASVALVSLFGCKTDDEEDFGARSQTPWGRPAPWEGGLPGMGGVNAPNQY